MSARSPFAQFYPNTLADGSEAAVGTRVVDFTEEQQPDHSWRTGVVTALGSTSADPPTVRWDGDSVAVASKRQTMQRVVLVGVTGCSRSCKTWLSWLLKSRFPDMSIISQEDFVQHTTVDVTLSAGRSVTKANNIHASTLHPMRVLTCEHVSEGVFVHNIVIS